MSINWRKKRNFADRNLSHLHKQAQKNNEKTHHMANHAEEISDNRHLLEQSIAGLPYTLSVPVKKTVSALEKQEYGKAMYHVLDFFEISIPFVSFVFLRLLQEESERNQQVRPALEAYVNRVDQKRPLSLGD